MLDLHDAFSSLSHLVTAFGGLIAGAFLVRLTRGHGPVRRAAILFYAVALVVLYTASGLFHGVRYSADGSPEYHLFRRLDQSAIFLLVAGSCLPLFAYLLSGAWRLWCTVAVLALAAAGILTLWVVPQPSSAVLVVEYSALAVVGVLPMTRYAAVAGWKVVRWVGWAAAIYVAGGLFEVVRWPLLAEYPDGRQVGPHELLHLCDIAATSVHYGLLVWLVKHPRVATTSVSERGASAPRGLGGLTPPAQVSLPIPPFPR